MAATFDFFVDARNVAQDGLNGAVSRAGQWRRTFQGDKYAQHPVKVTRSGTGEIIFRRQFQNRHAVGLAIYGSENGWHNDASDYATTVELILQAGAKLPEKIGGTDAVKEVLHRFGVREPGQSG